MEWRPERDGVTVSPLFSPLNIPFYDSPIAPTLPCHLQRFPHSPATRPLQSRSGPTVGISLGTQEWALRCYFPLFLLIISFTISCLHCSTTFYDIILSYFIMSHHYI